jgi:hypothetical protein
MSRQLLHVVDLLKLETLRDVQVGEIKGGCAVLG